VTPAELTGRARTHIAEVADPACALHGQVVTPFLNLRRAAAGEGFDLIAASSYRDFARQLSIWNAKFTGAATLYDAEGQALESAGMAPPERIEAILLWSALPGASRHHWGTDIDVIDRAAIAPGYRVQLTAAEFAPGGPFARIAEWLEANAARFGFFRPYRGARSGVRPEPWHFSFAPVAESARRALDARVLRETLEPSDLAGKEFVLARLEALHERYVARIDWP
jgi:LAS superfamily LD-carboxypeptidase LdcB